jgi:tetratricopeptide (TPR) repeat protein
MPSPYQEVRSYLKAGDVESARINLESMGEKNGENPSFKALYGNVLMRCQEIQKGKTLVEESALTEPDTSSWAADLALGLLLIGNQKKAKDMALLSTELPETVSAGFNLLGAITLAEGNLEGAERLFKNALLVEPDRPEVLNNLGGIAVRLGKLSDALSYYDRALSFNATLPQSIAGRTAMLVALERADEAVLDLEGRLEKEPDSIPLRCQMAHLLEAANRFDEACAALKETIDQNEDNIELLLQLAVLVLSRSRLIAALWALQKAEKLEPENPVVLNMLARTYIEAGAIKKAEETIDRLMDLHPDAPGSLLARAALRSAQDNFDGAEDDLQKVLEVLPGSAAALGNLGHNMMLTGRLTEAVKCFEKAAQINPASLVSLIEARSFPDDPATIEQMASFVKNPLTAIDPRASMAFAMAKVFENRGEPDQAFQYADLANDLTHKRISYKPESYRKLTAAIEAVFTPELLHRFKDSGVMSERPVFVVGMPRSGTTLTEQILCSHPDVFGAGELGYISSITKIMPRVLKKQIMYPGCMKFFQKRLFRYAAAYYLNHIKKMDDKSARVVDKMPHNFLHLGLISIIFPKAKIIHVRRDYRDIAISNYFTNFKHKHGGMGYAFSLEDIGRMINDYRKIMDHWRKVLPVPMFEFNYEDLVEDQEGMARKLLDSIGLDWHKKVMDFHKTERTVKTASVWQVRQPIYKTSRARWRFYENHLDPLLDVLADYDDQKS